MNNDFLSIGHTEDYRMNEAKFVKSNHINCNPFCQTGLPSIISSSCPNTKRRIQVLMSKNLVISLAG
jgi:hypothetical protein